MLVSGLVYFLADNYHLDKTDRLSCIIIGVGIWWFINLKNRLKWLPLPDGSYLYINELKDDSPDLNFKSYTVEPTSYISTFYNSVNSKIGSVFCGLIMIAYGIYIFSRTIIISPILMIIGGLFLLNEGYKEIIDKSPKLKLAKEGLWTKELGFKPWSTISKIEIKKDNDYRETQTYLEIYLKDNGIDYPDQQLPINNMTDKDKIKPIIDELFTF